MSAVTDDSKLHSCLNTKRDSLTLPIRNPIVKMENISNLSVPEKDASLERASRKRSVHVVISPEVVMINPDVRIKDYDSPEEEYHLMPRESMISHHRVSLMLGVGWGVVWVGVGGWMVGGGGWGGGGGGWGGGHQLRGILGLLSLTGINFNPSMEK